MKKNSHLSVFVVCAVCSITTLPRQASAQSVVASPVTAEPSSQEEQAPSTGRPSHGLFAQIVSDFRSLPSKDSLAILSIGGVGALVSHQFDSRVTSTFSSSPGLGTVTGAGNSLGSMQVQFGTALATYAVGKATHSPTVTSIGSDLVRAQIVSQTLTQGIKIASGRTRPDGTKYSFPSGHTSSAFATAAVLQRHLGWTAGIPAYGLAAYVAASRVQTRRHYLSDVAFGAAVGMVAGRTVTIGHGGARFAVAPAISPGSAGVNLTWVGKK